VRNHWGFFLAPPIQWEFFELCIGSLGHLPESNLA